MDQVLYTESLRDECKEESFLARQDVSKPYNNLPGTPVLASAFPELGEVLQVVVVGPHGGARKWTHLRLGFGPAVVLEEGLIAVVDAGNLERGRGCSGIAAGDLDMRTPDVELSACVRLVRSRLLDTDEVLTGGNFGRHLEGELLHLPGDPVAIGGRAGPVTPLSNLEPVAGSVIVADVTRSLGHVNLLIVCVISINFSSIPPFSREFTSIALNKRWVAVPGQVRGGRDRRCQRRFGSRRYLFQR